jgi:hypothetical protein
MIVDRPITEMLHRLLTKPCNILQVGLSDFKGGVIGPYGGAGVKEGDMMVFLPAMLFLIIAAICIKVID